MVDSRGRNCSAVLGDSAMKKEWTFRLLFDRYRVTVEDIPRPRPRQLLAPIAHDPVSLVRHFVYSASTDHQLRRCLEEVYQSTGGNSSSFALRTATWGTEPVLTDMERHLEARVRAGLIHIERLPRAQLRHAPVEPITDITDTFPEPPLSPKEEEATTWFEVTFADERGEPVDGMQLRLVQGQTAQQHTTGSDGKVRLDDTLAAGLVHVYAQPR